MCTLALRSSDSTLDSTFIAISENAISRKLSFNLKKLKVQLNEIENNTEKLHLQVVATGGVYK